MATVIVGPVSRYPGDFSFTTARDPFSDLVLHLEFLTALDSAAELLRQRHIDTDDVTQLAASVSAHARLASAFLRQAAAGPDTVKFVPAYYASLNLAKICILFSPEHHRLRENRLHGAAYDPTQTPASLREDRLTLHQKGAIPLFFEVLTGLTIPEKKTIKMEEVYRLIADVSAEWGVATGGASWLAEFRLRTREDSGGITVEVEVRSDLASPQLNELPALRNMAPSTDRKEGLYQSAKTYPRDTSVKTMLDDLLDRRLLYHSGRGEIRSAVRDLRGLHPVEELPLILAFYHMSSVARYNPDFLDQLRASRYWPVAAALTEHGLYKFLLLCWSFIRNADVRVVRI